MLKGILVAASLFAVSGMCRAAGDETLFEAYEVLKEGPIARAASLKLEGVAIGTARPQGAGTADYCVARAAVGTEGMPNLYRFSCTNGVQIPAMSRWCLREKCRVALAAEMAAMMRAAGYAPLTSFYFGMRPELSTAYSVFQRAEAAPVVEPRHCLVQRYGHCESGSCKASYRIDCADGAVTELRTDEPNGGTSAISRYLGDRGYELVGVLEKYRDSFAPLLFRGKSSR